MGYLREGAAVRAIRWDFSGAIESGWGSQESRNIGASAAAIAGVSDIIIIT
jgi:hypothetical protein